MTCGITGVTARPQEHFFVLTNRSLSARGIGNIFAYGPEGFDRLLSAIISSRLYGKIDRSTQYIDRVVSTRENLDTVDGLRFGSERILIYASEIKIHTYSYIRNNVYCLACGARQKEAFAACNPSMTQVLCARCYWQSMAEIIFADSGERFNGYAR